jgi:hypothetical protein
MKVIHKYKLQYQGYRKRFVKDAHKFLDFWKINTNKVEIEEVTTYGSNASHVPMEKCQSIWYCVQSIFKRVVRYDLFTNKNLPSILIFRRN